MFYSRWYQHMSAIKPWHRYFFSLCIIAFALICWLLLLYFPLQKSITFLTVHLAQEQKDNQIWVVEQKACKVLAKDIEQLKTQFGAHTLSLEATLQKTIGVILDTIEQAELQFNAYQLADTINKEWYQTIRLHIQAHGSLQAIEAFFELLQKKRLCMQCVQATMQHEKDDQFLLQATLKLFVPKKNSK